MSIASLALDRTCHSACQISNLHGSAGRLRSHVATSLLRLKIPREISVVRLRHGLSDRDLLPVGSSFIARVYRLDLGILVPRLAQVRRARSPQFAQALGTLATVSGCSATTSNRTYPRSAFFAASDFNYPQVNCILRLTLRINIRSLAAFRSLRMRPLMSEDAQASGPSQPWCSFLKAGRE